MRRGLCSSARAGVLAHERVDCGGLPLNAQATQVRHQELLVGVFSAVCSACVEERHEGGSCEGGAGAAERAQRHRPA
eukprot:2249922-Pleurochrysis_carterae.AAC.1